MDDSTHHPGSAGTPHQPSCGLYLLLLTASPTTFTHQPLLTYLHWGRCTTVRVPILSHALASLLHHLGYNAGPFSLHSLRRGGAMAAYRQGLDQIDIKCQGLWTSDAFWQYITSSSSTTSPLAERLARRVHAPSFGTLPLPPPPPHPPPPSHASSSTHRYHLVTKCCSSSHHHNHHHHSLCGNHALSCCGNLSLSGCSESQPAFVRLKLTIMVNLG